MGGGVEVDIVVVVSAKEVGHVEGAGHGEHSGEDVGMSEGNVCRVKSAKAAAEGDEPGVLIFEADEGYDFVEQVVFKLEVTGDTPAGQDVSVVPGLHIDGVDAVELELPGVEFVGEGGDEMAIFKLEEAAAGGGKNEYGEAGMTVDEELHIAAELGGKPLVILAMQGTNLRTGIPGWLFREQAIFDTVTATGMKILRRDRGDLF